MLFSYGRVVTGKLFYDRTKTKAEILKYVKSGQSFMLKAPRRYGKTSLLKHLLQEQSKEYFYVDFRKTPRLEIFNNRLLEFIYSRMGIKGAMKQLRENAFAFMRAHNAILSIGVGFFEASIELYFSNKSQEDKLMEILEYLNELSMESSEPLYMVFDEFQDAAKLTKEIDFYEALRAEIQHHENICYMFAGSNMTLMTEIFEKKKAPFYNFCRKKNLAPFDTEELSVEVQKAFRGRGVVFQSDAILKTLIRRCGGHPANTMLVLQNIEHKMLDLDTQIITQEIVDISYGEVQEEMSDLVIEYLKEIRQKEHLHDVIYREANKEAHVLEPSSLQQKRKYLVDMGHLQIVERGKYQIIDNFLRDELLSQNIF